jgi:DNA-binding transcriptional ArsR family regulator
MSVLTNAKLVASRKQGKWVYYFLPARLPTGLRSWLASSLKSSAVIKADHGALNKIVASTSESLCKKRRLRSALNRR